MNILVDRPQPVVDDIFVLIMMCLDSSKLMLFVATLF